MICVCTICAQFQDQCQPKFVHALNELSGISKLTQFISFFTENS